MAKRFVNISKDKMEAFLLEQGFQAMNLPNVSELVYGKVFSKDGHKLSMRIYPLGGEKTPTSLRC